MRRRIKTTVEMDYWNRSVSLIQFGLFIEICNVKERIKTFLYICEENESMYQITD